MHNPAPLAGEVTVLWGRESWGGQGPSNSLEKPSLNLMKFPQQVLNTKFTLKSRFFPPVSTWKVSESPNSSSWAR